MKGPTIDWSQIDELRSSDPDGDQLLKELIELFRKNSPARLEAIRQAVDAKDLSKIKKEAHALRSSSCYLGASGIAEMTHRLEAETNFEAMPKLLREIELECGQVLEQVSKVLTA